MSLLVFQVLVTLIFSTKSQEGKILKISKSPSTHVSVASMFLTQPSVLINVFLGQNSSLPVHTPVLVRNIRQREQVMSMAFTMVTIPVTRNWVRDILTVDEEKGDVRLRKDWEKIFSERGITDSTNFNQKGKLIFLSNYTNVSYSPSGFFFLQF